MNHNEHLVPRRNSLAQPFRRSSQLDRLRTNSDARNTNPKSTVARLLPVVTRAVDLGRGSPALMGWLRERLYGVPSPTEWTGANRSAMLNRLANELAVFLSRSQPKPVPGSSPQKSAPPELADTVTGSVAPTPQPSGAPAKSTKETILLTEDDPAVRNLMKLILRPSGYQLLEASNGT